jgi:hypothetical protein
VPGVPVTLSFASKCLLTTIAGAALLAGCATGVLRQPFDFAQGDKAGDEMPALSGAVPGRAAKASGVAKSWMSPDTKDTDLIYISDSATYDIYVYVYSFSHHLRLIGTLTDQNNPAGLCVDHKGDVFVTQLYGHQIVEYKHGGTTPINTLSDPGYEPGACSVDPKTGNLAVANIVSDEFTQGNLVVYPKAKGNPITYSPPGGASGNWFSVNTVGYDSLGQNAYFAGTCDGAFCAGVLPTGSSGTENLTLNVTPKSPGTVQVGEYGYVTFDDQSDGTLYGYTFEGTVGTERTSTMLSGSSDVDGSWIMYWLSKPPLELAHTYVIAPQQNGADVLLYNYRNGASPFATLTGVTQPFGATYSGRGHDTW